MTPHAHYVTVLGDPVPKGRPRFLPGGRAYTPKRTREAEREWEYACMAAGVRPLTGDLVVHIWFYRKTKRRVDLDNLIKLVLDGCNTRLWLDDSQIKMMTAQLGYDSVQPRTEIKVARIDWEGTE